MNTLTHRLTEAVKEHAIRHYNSGGWDYIVECYTDEDIAELIQGCRTEAGAIKKVAKVMGWKDDYRQEIIATAF